MPSPVASTPQSLSSAAQTLSSLLVARSQSPCATSHPHLAHRLEVPVLTSSAAVLPWLRSHPLPQKLYFASRNSSFQVAALSFSYHASGPVYTHAVHTHLSSILNPAYPNMRFYGAYRFHNTRSTKHQSSCHPHWAPYHGYTFVLPAVELICYSDDHVCLALNFYPPTGIDHIIRILSSIAPPSLSLLSYPPTFTVPLAQSVESLTKFDAWGDAMTKVLDHISTHKYSKIVLARQKQFTFDPKSPPRPLHILSALVYQNLKLADSSCALSSSTSMSKVETQSNPYVFCLQLDHDKAFLGCTPEQLFKFDGRMLLAEALAGTVRRSTKENEQEALKTLLNEKNVKEHQFVIDYITAALANSGLNPTTDGPHIRRLPRLMHLATHISAELPISARDKDVHTYVFQLLSQLHPTPAVCGVPLQVTMQHIEDIEGYDRGLFAGPFGWFSSQAAEFCVAIRSANVFGQYVTAYAGCGIVEGSESVSEWDETELKMSAFTDLFSSRYTIPSQHSSPSSTPPLVTSPPSPNGNPLRDASSSTSTLLSKSCSNGEFFDMIHQRAPNQEQLQLDEKSKTNESEQQQLQQLQQRQPSYFDSQTLEDEPNLNSLWGSCVVEELVRNHISMFFVSPGSRSAPLAVGATRNRRATVIIAHDERGAGFMAVGYARATGRAAAVITSSGTAVGNLLPAVIEGHMDGLPIVILTADRPPELFDVGANQAIYQPGIFGRYVNWSKDVACPCEDIPLRNILSDIDYAVYKSGSELHCLVNKGREGRERGPVYLNFMFREKLAPDEQRWNRKYLSNLGPQWTCSLSPLTSYLSTVNVTSNMAINAQCNGAPLRSPEMPMLDERLSDVCNILRRTRKGMILLGGGRGSILGEDDGLCLYELSEFLNWPILSDICGGLRLDRTHHGVVHYADVMLSSTALREHFIPDAVLQFGERVTSKRVKSWIREASQSSETFAHVIVTDSSKRSDEHFTVTHRIEGNVSSMWHILRDLERASDKDPRGKPTRDNGTTEEAEGRVWMKELLNISNKVGKHINSMAYETDGRNGAQNGGVDNLISEISCAHTISKCIGKGRVKSVYIGNSMPIRDLDTYGAEKMEGMRTRIVGNRGASGIDGIVSSAIGFMTGWSSDTTVILGDMSFIHDLNALHALRQEESTNRPGRLTVVVVNNGGGGIFSMLPIAKHSSVFSPVFDTPHSTQFDGVCKTFGIDYVQVSRVGELIHALSDDDDDGVVTERSGHRVIEVVVSSDHERNVSLHNELKNKVVKLVEETLSSRHVNGTK